MDIQQKQHIENQLLAAIDQFRSMVIDPVEIAVGDSPCWPSLRKQILKVFGDRGLSARVKEVLDRELDKQHWSDL